MVELVSLHIPKTAGSAFKSMLQNIYQECLFLDYENATADVQKVRAIHGHIPANKYAEICPHAKYVMWMRNPVERIISYYYFWMRTAPHGNPNHDYVVNNQLSLIEFAQFPPIRNEFFGYYLKNFNIDRFFFIGITERFTQDVQKLAQKLSWPTIPIPKENVAPQSPEVSHSVRDNIIKLYKKELELYKHIVNSQKTTLRTRLKQYFDITRLFAKHRSF